MLTPEKSYLIHFKDGKNLPVKVKIIPDNAVAIKNCASWCKKGQYMKPKRNIRKCTPRAIIVHNSDAIRVNHNIANTMSEQYTLATWPNCNMGGVVVHYYVDPIESWKNLDDYEQGWHAADGSSIHPGHAGATFDKFGGNIDGIAVEIIGPDSEDNGARLIAYLLWKHKLKIEDVYTHNYCMYGDDKIHIGVRKNCPIYILDHWQKFLSLIQKYYSLLGKKDNTVKKEESKSMIYVISSEEYKNRDEAEKALKAFKEKGYTNAYIKSVKNGYYAYNKELLYNIQFGAFSSSDNAETFANVLRNKGIDIKFGYNAD